VQRRTTQTPKQSFQKPLTYAQTKARKTKAMFHGTFMPSSQEIGPGLFYSSQRQFQN